MHFKMRSVLLLIPVVSAIYFCLNINYAGAVVNENMINLDRFGYEKAVKGAVLEIFG